MSAPCPRLGFLVRVVLHPDTDQPAVIRTRQSFAAWANGRGLSFRLRGTIRHWAYPVWREGSQADDADREAVMAWGAAQDEVLSVAPELIVDLDDDGR